MESTKPSGAAIKAFLLAALSGGPIAVRHLHERAIAAGFLADGDGPPLWRRKPWRRAAERLEVKHYQENREWFWRLPANQNAQVPEALSQVPKTLPQVPTISNRSVVVPEPTIEPEMIEAALRSFLASRRRWNGKPSQLLEALRAENKDWPANPKAFSAALRGSAEQLRNAGITITFG